MDRPFAVPHRVALSLHTWPQVSVAGAAVSLGLKYGLALLAYLALVRRRASRLHLATLLWPDAAEAVARTRLRRLVYAVNEACGVEVLAGAPDTLWIDEARVRLDCDVLGVQALAQRWMGSSPATATEAPPEALFGHDAHRLLEGFWLDSCGYQDWIAQQRMHHERLLAQGLQRCAERCIAAGDIATAQAAAERLIALDPLAESGYAQLMVALGHRGDASAIEAAYFRCAGLLRNEYGTTPSGMVETAYASACAMARQAPVVELPVAAADSAETGDDHAIAFARAPDGVRLAYAVSGHGMPVIKAATWLSHLEHDRDSPVWGHLVRELSRQFTYVRYDERGCGLSDWDVADLSFASWLSDLETVADALALPRFALLGISQGASIAIAYAVRHPRRVSRLVLHGGYARGRLVRSDTPQQREEAEMMAKLAELGWGKSEPSFRQFFTSQFIPDGTAEQHEWFNELERISTSPANAARFMREFAQIDVLALLPQVRCPTLVLHSLDDVRVPAQESQLIADAIPGARFVPIHSRNHLLLQHEAGWPHWLEEVRGFLSDAE
jgi:pimeloyl-ACP methyl ester carboxylesterase/DNA-binding SARP family transcriptional activator